MHSRYSTTLNPASPTFVGGCATDPETGINVHGSYAYPAAGNGLNITDINNPIDPYRIGYHDTGGQAMM